MAWSNGEEDPIRPKMGCQYAPDDVAGQLPPNPASQRGSIIGESWARSADRFIGPVQHLRRDRETELLGRLHVNDQLELYRPLHGEVRWLGTL